jgi:hypothetical protein
MLNQIGHRDVNWIHLAQDRFQWWDLVNMVMHSVTGEDFID